MDIAVTVQQQDFDVAQLCRALQHSHDEVGGLASFVGVMRGSSAGEALRSMTLEHYPGMTESSIQAIIEQAGQRWPLLACRVVHRVGQLLPGEQIVFVGCATRHRAEAFQACEFVMDYLKSQAPFWKKETTVEGRSQWVDARDSDRQALAKWQD